MNIEPPDGFEPVTLAQLVEKIRIVAATEPDRVYVADPDVPECNYRPNKFNSCGCIVGEGLAEAGVPVSVLAELDAGSAEPLGDQTGVGWGDPQCKQILARYVTSRALNSKWVRYVQSAQDAHLPWGDAVREADRQSAMHEWARA